MENTQTENQTTDQPNNQSTQTNYDITLENVPYDDNYRIKFGSISQLMRGLQVMQPKITSDKETDNYKQVLYPKLRELSQSLVNKFIPMLSASSEKERNVRNYNLCGYEGQIRPDKFNRYPFVSGVNPNAKYGYANFGYFMRTLKQRLEFIASRDLPTRYSSDEVLTNTFNLLKLECNNLVKYLVEYVEPEWNKVVDDARKNGGELVIKNLQSRNEAREKRNNDKQNKNNDKQNRESRKRSNEPRVVGEQKKGFKKSFVQKFVKVSDNQNHEVKDREYVSRKESNKSYVHRKGSNKGKDDSKVEGNRETNGFSRVSRRGTGSFRGRNFRSNKNTYTAQSNVTN